MEEELSTLSRHAANINDEISAQNQEEEEFLNQDGAYSQVHPSGDDDDEYDNQEWSGGLSEKCNLIVNYLPHEIDDVTLKTLFVDHGDIAVAKVVKDKVSKKSLGYGFVKFMREEDALAAIDAMNGFLMGHKKFKVSLARPPSIEIRNCKLYVTNLPKDFTERDVVDLFAQFGEIIECRVLKYQNSKSNKGVAFVQFNLKSQANNALSLNGFQPQGCDRHLLVKYAEDQHKIKDRRRQTGGMPGGPMGMNMMDGMAMMDMKQDIRDPYFYNRSRIPSTMYRSQQSSPVQMGQMSHNLGGNQLYLPATMGGYPSSRGIGKNMSSSSMPPSSNSNTNSLDWYGQMPQMVYDNQMSNAQHAQSQLGYDQRSIGQQMMGQSQQRQGQGQRNAYASSPRAAQETGYSGSVTLIIGCLPQHADVALLHDLCAPYGRIISAVVDVDTTGAAEGSAARGGCTGRGRVQMAGLSQAQYATNALNGAIIFEGGRPLEVTISYSGSGGSRSGSNGSNQQQTYRGGY